MSKCVYDRMISVGISCITSTMIRCKYFNDKTEDVELFYDKNLFTSDKYLPGSIVFDWLITPPESLLKCLEMDFEGFSSFENFSITKKGRNSCSITNHFYDIKFEHFDKRIAKFPYHSRLENGVTDYFLSIFENRISKYVYLIEKFKMLKSSNEKILFVCNISRRTKKLDVFYEVLKQLNNYCDADLLVVTQRGTEIKKSRSQNLFFENVVAHGNYTPHIVDEYTSWMNALNQFKLKRESD